MLTLSVNPTGEGSPLDPADFKHVEGGNGSPKNRGEFGLIEDVEAQLAQDSKLDTYGDCYHSIFLFSADAIRYAKEHPNENTGNPSLKGYPGPAYATCLRMDFDHKPDPSKAQEEIRHLVQIWEEKLGLPRAAIRYFFTGSKGFHVEIPSTLFGGFEASTDIAYRMRSLALSLVETMPGSTLDLSIYHKVGLIRVPYSRNSKTGLCKIPLTADEFFTLDLAAIKKLAENSRQGEVTWVPDSEWFPREGLVALWKTTADRTPQKQVPERRERVRAAVPSTRTVTVMAETDPLVRLVAEHWPGPDSHLRHSTALALAGGLLRMDGWDADAVKELVGTAARLAGDEDWEDRVDDVRDTAQSLENDHLVTGFSTLKELLGEEPVKSIIQLARQRFGKPQIVVTNRPERDMTADAVTALEAHNSPPVLFRRSAGIVRIRDDEYRRPIIERVTEPMMRAMLSDAADFVHDMGGPSKNEHASPPKGIVQSVLVHPRLPFPRLEGITQIPILRPDGSVHSEPGYDPVTCLYHSPPATLRMPPIPDAPSDEDIAAAKGVLDDLLVDFPFTDTASRATAYGALLTPLVRPAIEDGGTPMLLINAPQAGTGKTYLANLVSVIATGRQAALMSVATSEDEWRKKITSLLMDGSPMIVFDNLEGPLKSASLASALTASEWKDRRLGGNENVTIPQRSMWIVTGNNIHLRGDLARRTVLCRLDAKSSRPWEREDFRHPDLLGYAAYHRGEIIAALITLVRAWVGEGRPKPQGASFHSFEQWRQIVGGVLEVAHIEGFMGNRAELHEIADEEGREWGAFLESLYSVFGSKKFTVSRIIDEIETDESLLDHLPGDLADYAKASGFGHRLGKACSDNVDVRRNGLRLVRAAGLHHKAAQWQIKTEEQD